MIILDKNELLIIRNNFKENGKKVVFTNGCFDIIHAGHVDYLKKSKDIGDILIVALNTDNSVKRNKGEKRPIINEKQRLFVMDNLKPVDFVTLFDEDTPYELIKFLVPDFLIKGEDWQIDSIIGKDIVEAAGGKVERVKFVNNVSTSIIINKILDSYSK